MSRHILHNYIVADIIGTNVKNYNYVEPFIIVYKLEEREFDSLCGRWDFSLTSNFRPHYGPRL